MALTVADVLKLKPFATGKVIAGENGVTRKVEQRDGGGYHRMVFLRAGSRCLFGNFLNVCPGRPS